MSGNSDFAGLVAVVTGGASGIGAATAATLAHRGARVAILDPADAAPPEGGIAVSCDVTDERSVSDSVAAVITDLGGIDVLVNNAGIGAVGSVEDHPIDEWRRVFDVNVFGAVRMTRAALPYLRDSQNASIVNTSSVVADVGVPARALYSASKGALAALTRAMAADHLPDGIRVNAVVPGTAATPWVERLLDKAADAASGRIALEARQPLGRLVTAEEVAHAVAYLASPMAAATTGTFLAVDGGLTGVRLPPSGG